MRPARTIVLGLGSVIQSDDAAGVCALRELQRHPGLLPGLKLIEGGTQGLDLLPFLAGVRRLLVLDAVDAAAPPGTVVRFAGEEVRRLRGNGSAHELALADLMVAMRMLGEDPEEVVLLGIQPEKTELGTLLTPAVEAALPRLVDAALAELARWAATPCVALPAASRRLAV